jgi:hypothetical protein
MAPAEEPGTDQMPNHAHMHTRPPDTHKTAVAFPYLLLQRPGCQDSDPVVHEKRPRLTRQMILLLHASLVLKQLCIGSTTKTGTYLVALVISTRPIAYVHTNAEGTDEGNPPVETSV